MEDRLPLPLIWSGFEDRLGFLRPKGMLLASYIILGWGLLISIKVLFAEFSSLVKGKYLVDSSYFSYFILLKYSFWFSSRNFPILLFGLFSISIHWFSAPLVFLLATCCHSLPSVSWLPLIPLGFENFLIFWFMETNQGCKCIFPICINNFLFFVLYRS